MNRWEETPDLGLPVLCDLDGTLSERVENTTGGIGKPIPEAIEALRKLINAGFTVKIYTARHWGDEPLIKAWLVKQNLKCEIICGKPLGHIYDDKADRPSELIKLSTEL
jgi:hypothetical protein